MRVRSMTLPVVFVTGLLVGLCFAWTLQAQQRRTGDNKLLLKKDLAACAGQEITIALNQFSPGSSGPHYHAGESFTYILDGSETYQLEGSRESVFKAGDLRQEEAMKVHTSGNSVPLKLLVIRVQPKGSPDIVRVESKR